MGKVYIVKYNTGEYEDYREVSLFVTRSKSTAKKYVAKFNRVVKNYKEFYSKFEEDKCSMRWIKQKHLEYFDRWMRLYDIDDAYFSEIEER